MKLTGHGVSVLTHRVLLNQCSMYVKNEMLLQPPDTVRPVKPRFGNGDI